MSLTSMTGFARADGSSGDYSWHWEVKSVNGKGLDVRLRLPNGLEALEAEIRKIAARYFRRGNLQMGLQLTREGGASQLAINEKALEQVMKAASDLRRKLDAPPLTVEGLLSLRGVLELVEAEDSEDQIAARNTAILASAEEAFESLAAARAEEGAAMADVIAGHIDQIEKLTKEAITSPDRTPEAIRARLSELVERLMEEDRKFDADRLHAEAILMATKADILEELDRLVAHIAAARKLLKSDEAVGRKFDFLAQEFNREANTLCSKAATSDLSRIGLEMKTVIDQLREQVQNIE